MNQKEMQRRKPKFHTMRIQKVILRFIPHSILVFFLIGFSAQVFATEKDITFRHITDKDGLQYNWIWDIYKDSEGFIWFSSQEGAFRYDGSEFKEYTFLASSGFPYLRINLVFEDHDSTIWFGTNEGVIRYTPEENSFSRIHLDSLGNNSSNLINAITQDSHGKIWIATDHGLFSYETEQSEFAAYFSSSDTNTLNNNSLNELLIDSKDNLWIGDNIGGLYQYVPHNDYFLQYENPDKDIYSRTNVLYEDHQGYIWVGYEGAGVAKFNTWSKEYVKHHMKRGDDNEIASNFVRGIAESNNQTIWFGTENGISVLNQEEDSFTTITSSFDDHSGLNDNAIYSMFKEENGDIWIGTFFGGVNVFHNQPRFIQTHIPDGSANKISGRAIGPIVEDSDLLWIGTEDNGLNKFDPGTNVFEHFTQQNSNISHDNIHAISKDHLGNLWVGTYTGGLNKLSANAESFIHFTHSDNISSLSNNSIYKIFNDSEKNLWVGTRGGLDRYDYSSQSFERIHSDILGGLFIWDIEEDHKGNIWLCTYTQGVFILEKHNNYRPRHIPLPVNQTINLHIRDNYQLLIGTEKQGLIIYDLKTGEHKHLTHDDSLPDNTIYGLVEDNSKSIWLTTNNGLARTRDFETYETYTVYDGLPTNRFNYNSAATVNGKLYFGSIRGLVVVDPELQIFEEFIPSVHLTAIDFSDDQKKAKDYGRSINYMDDLELGSDFSSFSISYTGINLRCNKRVNYAVFMDGVNKDWEYVGGTNFATYYNLEPGYYRFHVRTVDKAGELQDNEKTLSIIINPPWWQTNLAKTIFFVIILTIIGVILFLLYSKAKVKLDLQFEKMEKQKIRDINKAKIDFFTNISHEFKTPLTLIKGPISRLIYDNKINDYQRSWYLSLIKKNAERLLHLINELLGFRNEGHQQHALKLEEVNIKDLFDDLMENYYWLAESNSINFTFSVDDSVKTICLDSIKIEKVLNNLLINAFTNTPQDGFVSLEAFIKKDYLHISVKNSGKGISPKNISKVFEKSYSDNQNTHINEGTGLGLFYAKALVELHKGKIEVYSLENVETSFVIKLPANLQAMVSGGNGGFDITGQSKIIEEMSLPSDNQPSPLYSTKPKILIAEDVKELRDFLSDSLNQEYTVLTASNGLEAFKMAQAEHPDIIISDVLMPKMNGYELCKKIKNTFTTSDIRVILLTILSENNEKLIGYKSGADAYIAKPFDIELLVSRIENLLRDSFSLKQKFQKNLDMPLKEITYSNPDEELLKMIYETVNNHISDIDFDVNKFAQEIGLSKSTLYRKMKVITGLSANKFVQVIRLKRAAQLLRDTKLSVSEIAYDVGFNDPYYFSRAFKENFNASPKNYREGLLITEQQ